MAGPLPEWRTRGMSGARSRTTKRARGPVRRARAQHEPVLAHAPAATARPRRTGVVWRKPCRGPASSRSATRHVLIEQRSRPRASRDRAGECDHSYGGSRSRHEVCATRGGRGRGTQARDMRHAGRAGGGGQNREQALGFATRIAAAAARRAAERRAVRSRAVRGVHQGRCRRFAPWSIARGRRRRCSRTAPGSCARSTARASVRGAQVRGAPDASTRHTTRSSVCAGRSPGHERVPGSAHWDVVGGEPATSGHVSAPPAWPRAPRRGREDEKRRRPGGSRRSKTRAHRARPGGVASAAAGR